MKCQNKRSFLTLKEAKFRGNEINHGIKNNKQKYFKNILRAYECKQCRLFHLTSMTTHEFKYRNDFRYRAKINTIQFIERESAYWIGYFDKILNRKK